MKKILSIMIIGILIISGLGAVALSNNNEKILKEEIKQVSISTPVIIDNDNYFTIDLNEATSYEMIPGEPEIPKVTKVYVIPFGSTVKEVNVDFSQVKKISLSKQIKPAQEPLIDGKEYNKEFIKSDEIYSSSDLYPVFKYNYKTNTGIYGKERVVFINVHCYPVRYSPSKNMLFYNDNFEIKIEYEEPANPILFPDEYDLLIISPSEFSDELQRLVDFKNDHNMRTYLVNLDEIYSEFTDGRDKQENIKLFIKNEIEEKGIIYVLLVGGMIGQQFEWYLPVRYAHSPSEEAYISDLYFSDIYKENGTAFEDWDSNGNGKFAEYSGFKKDVIDGIPDIHIGRLPCRDLDQVITMVNKIISYEKGPADESWFKNMLLIGGDTYPDSGHPDGYEAEIDTNLSASYMDGFEFERLWASLGTLTGQEDVERAINDGAGFIHMAGHANPSILVTHPPNENKKITILHMYNLPILNALGMIQRRKGFDRFLEELMKPRFPTLTNNEKQPVILVGGCHNSQFNTSLLNIIEDGFMHAYGWGEFVPKCWSWWLTSKENGGAIATIGNTGLGMGLPGFNYVNGLDGWLYPRFFYNYRQLGRQHVGEAHSAAIADYVNEFDINMDGEDRQMIQQWALLGDPSLMLGGYS